MNNWVDKKKLIKCGAPAVSQGKGAEGPEANFH